MAPLLPAAPSGVRHVPDSIGDADALLAFALGLDWRRKMRARSTASFGRPYDYSGQSYEARPMPDPIVRAAEAVAALAGHGFDNCLCNLYETGHRSMGFHRDSYDGLAPNGLVAIVSLGAARTLVFRSEDRTTEQHYRLEHGSVLLMDRATQTEWLHGVPKEAGAGLRVSMTFRRFTASPGP